MIKQIAPAIAMALTLCTVSYAQEDKIWSLEECINYALEQSLTVERASLNKDISAVNLKESKHQRYPDLNASFGAGINLGRVINPATNNFETDDSYFNNLGMQTGMPLFAGNRINNSIKQSKLNFEASEEDLKQARVSLALDVALAYLNVLFAQENLRNATATRALSESQLEQIDKLIEAGSRPEAERFDIVAQIALNERDMVQFENDIAQNLLAMKQLMRLEPGYDLQIETPDLREELLEQVDLYTYDEVYQAALETQPQVKAQQLRVQSAELQERIAKGARMPTVSLGGSIGTNWSDLSKVAVNEEIQRIAVPDIYINNQAVLFEQEQAVGTEFETTPYSDQLDNALGYGFSLNVQIPIYNNYSNKAAQDRAKLATILEQNSEEQIKQTLKTDIQNALASGRAAREALEASQAAFDAADVAYKNSERRFDLGALNSYDLINARNNLDAARVNLTISKYDYIFRILIIEYYMGRGIKYE